MGRCTHKGRIWEDKDGWGCEEGILAYHYIRGVGQQRSTITNRQVKIRDHEN